MSSKCDTFVSIWLYSWGVPLPGRLPQPLEPLDLIPMKNSNRVYLTSTAKNKILITIAVVLALLIEVTALSVPVKADYEKYVTAYDYAGVTSICEFKEEVLTKR